MTRRSLFRTGAIAMLALASNAHAQCAMSFAPAVNYATATMSRDVAVADFNADGRPDLAVANDRFSPFPGHVSILLGNADGTFQAAVSYPTSPFSRPWSVAVGDFDTDGIRDLAVAGDLDVVSILRGNGNGTFQAPVAYAAGVGQAWSVAVSDFNADSRPDLAVTGWSGVNGGIVSILLANPSGTFQSPVGYPTSGTGFGDRSVSVAIGDFNVDGKPDLAVANNDTADVSVLLGIGNGTFQPAVNCPLGGSGGAQPHVAVGDFNADGMPDLAVANNGTLLILQGNGNGTFQTPVSYVAGGFDGGIVVGDFNADTRPDLAVGATGTPGSVSILLGTSAGTFQATVAIAAGPTGSRGLAVGDFNADGRIDLATALQSASCCPAYSGGVSVLLNTSGCYPDCTHDCQLNVNDFICFQTKFALGDPYADCDANGTRNINDFICFQTKFALGC